MENEFIKFNYDDIETYEMEDKCVSCVKEEIDRLVNNYKDELYCSLYECESPIEQLMAINLCLIEKKFCGFLNNIDFIGLEPQVNISVDNKNYRIDFLIEIAFKYNEKHEDLISIVIECDGYDFHQKTKEQVEKDYEKERLLQMNGYYVLRFSGSEIYNNLFNCRQIIIDFIYSKYYQFLRRFK